MRALGPIVAVVIVVLLLVSGTLYTVDQRQNAIVFQLGEVKEVVHKKSGAEDVLLHHRNLQNAIRKGEALNCPVELGLYGVVASEMGVLSLRRRAYMKWDKRGEKIVKA